MTAPTDSSPTSPEEVPAHFDRAFNGADADAVLAVFDETPTMRMTDGRVVEADRSQLRAAFAQMLSVRPHIRNEVRRGLRCDDLALVVMDWTVTVHDPEGRERVDRGTATQVMKRQADGSWRLKISNPLGVAGAAGVPARRASPDAHARHPGAGRRLRVNRRVGDASLYVEDRGAGELALVFLHYRGGTHRTWDRVTSRLAHSFRCVAYDMHGWGQSGAADGGYSMSDLADEAAALIRQLGLTRYVLVGHSMGGKVAQLLASRRPAGLAGLVLVAPAAPTPTHFPEDARQQQIHAYDNRETVLQTITFLSARTPAPDVVEQIVADSLSGAPGAKLAWPTAGILEDLSSEVSRIAVPTLVLAGERDRLDSVEQHRREIIARIPNARLEIVADSGHLVPIDEPAALARAIADFGAQVPA
ncbi:hypothetical protein tb265_19670 [Gemmatimonadetes bacterium T265]|nr:hypothetical protein tb265_19670 [Gemmatimonadetes bacterium T265]